MVGVAPSSALETMLCWLLNPPVAKLHSILLSSPFNFHILFGNIPKLYENFSVRERYKIVLYL